jgi:SAM-dependent methyltransferase
MTDPQTDFFARAVAAHAAGDFDTALQAYTAALGQDPNRLDALDGMTAILEGARTPRFHPGLAALLELAMTTKGTNPEALTRSATAQLALKYRMADPQASPSPDILAALARDRLLLLTLSACLVRDPAFEAFMCRVRRALCAPDAAPKLLPLVLALARQAVNNEYVWPIAPEDEAALGFVGNDGFGAARRAMFFPLAPDAANFAELADFAAEQINDANRQASAQSRIPLLQEISNATSGTVGAMYEQNPYPRWLHLRLQPPIDIRAALAQRFAWAGPFPAFSAPLRVLMPGAGTGQHPLSVAANYADVQVEAVDLSRASLAYGLCRAETIGVPNIHFAQGDLLDLPKLGNSWGHAEAIGVLHHMADPRAGLAALLDVVVPGSFVRLGLYGEAGRKIVVAARAAIAANGYGDTLGELRRFRADVLAGRLGAALQKELPQWSDFHSASLLRDLCFHPMEHRYDIAKLRALFDGLPARFLGFDFERGFAGHRDLNAPAIAAYKKRFPKEATLADLDNWQKLEAADPGLFAGYQFWLLRT